MAERYEELLRGVRDQLKPEGFKRSGRMLWIPRGHNYGAILFQRDKWNRDGDTQFTIEVAVGSDTLAVFNGRIRTEKTPPTLYDLEVRRRLGFLINGRDKWWRIEDYPSQSALSAEVLTLIQDAALPWLRDRLSDEQLIALWEAGDWPGINRSRGLVLLGALQKALGRSRGLDQTIAELESELADEPPDRAGYLRSALTRLREPSRQPQ